MENKKWYEGMHMLNRDPDWDTSGLWDRMERDESTPEACKKGIEEIFGSYRKPLTDVALCLFAQVALLPAKSYIWGGTFWELYRYSNRDGALRWRRPHMIFKEYGLDPVQIFIDQTTKNGIRPWATFRMNDCHPPRIATAMYAEAVENGQVVGESYGYYRHCFDFAYPKYRNAVRDLIKEVFDKYDFFGLELDFMREPYCYDYKNNPDCHKMMIEYLREIKSIMLEAEKRVGHEIKILIRVPSTPIASLQFGFDVKTMADEGLIDAVTPTPRWRTSDSGIPVREWKELVCDKIPVIPGIEYLNLEYTYTDVNMAKGYFASFFGQGADGSYLYNFFNQSGTPSTWDITKENCLEGMRQFIVTDQDIAAYPENRYLPLPMAVDGTAELPIEVGLIKPTDDVTLIIDFEGEGELTVSALGRENVAGVKINPVTRKICGKPESANLTPHRPLAFDFSGCETPAPMNLTFTGNGTVHYVEVMIDAK